MLSERYVEQIFTRMLVRYGSAWLAMWKGLDEEGMAAVRQDWGQVLGGFSGLDIRYGLDNLPPDRPPNALQFRDLCRRAPATKYVELPAPKPDPERLKAAIEKLKAVRADLGSRRFYSGLE